MHVTFSHEKNREKPFSIEIISYLVCLNKLRFSNRRLCSIALLLIFIMCLMDTKLPNRTVSERITIIANPHDLSLL